MKPELTNPYRSSTSPTLRLNLNAPIEDVQAVRSVILEQGALQNAWALFLNHLATYVRNNKLSLADRDHLVSYILERCGTSQPNQNPIDRNVGRTTPRVRKVRSGQTNVPTTSTGE